MLPLSMRWGCRRRFSCGRCPIEWPFVGWWMVLAARWRVAALVGSCCRLQTWCQVGNLFPTHCIFSTGTEKSKILDYIYRTSVEVGDRRATEVNGKRRDVRTRTCLQLQTKPKQKQFVIICKLSTCSRRQSVKMTAAATATATVTAVVHI